MARPRQDRYVSCEPKFNYFKPSGLPAVTLKETQLSVEGLEAMRLVYLAELPMDEAALRMRISRHTLGRILAEAQKSVTEALVYGHSLKILGGNYVIDDTRDDFITKDIKYVAVTCTGPSLDDMVDPRFGRADGFLIVNLDDMACEYIVNTLQHFNAGVEAVKTIKNLGAGALLTGHVGINAYEALKDDGIYVMQNLDNMTAREAVLKFVSVLKKAR